MNYNKNKDENTPLLWEPPKRKKRVWGIPELDTPKNEQENRGRMTPFSDNIEITINRQMEKQNLMSQSFDSRRSEPKSHFLMSRSLPRSHNLDRLLVHEWEEGKKEVPKSAPLQTQLIQINSPNIEIQSEEQAEEVDQDLVALQSGLIHIRDTRIKQVATDMETVKGLFHDLAYMINDQGEPIAQIEEEFVQTNENVEQGVEELIKANEWHRKKRKRMCGFTLASVVIGGVVITTIALVKKFTPGA